MDEELERLLKQARDLPPLTKDEIEAQRRSWAIGEMMLEHPELSRERVEEIYELTQGRRVPPR